MKLLKSVLILSLILSCAPQKVEQVKESPPKVKTVKNTKPVRIDFNTLSGFELPIEKQTIAHVEDIKYLSKSLPKKVQDLNKGKIIIRGFMVPVQYTKEEQIISFLLTADHNACCFGRSPALNRLIYCKSDKAYPDLRDTLLEISGTLNTEPLLNETDDTVYIYTMNIESIKELKTVLPIRGSNLSF